VNLSKKGIFDKKGQGFWNFCQYLLADFSSEIIDLCRKVKLHNDIEITKNNQK